MQKVIDAIYREKLIVIVRGVEADRLLPFAEAAYAGGVRLLELTYNAAAPEQDEANARSIEMLSRAFAGRMFIGAGTVLTPRQVALTAAAGGTFVISPNTDKAVIRATVEAGLVSIPGAFTPTEIVNAHKAGADFVKVFPANVLGCEYFRALAQPLSHIPLLAVGGINAEDLPAYLAAGAKGFGVSAAIADRKLIAEGRYDEVTAAAERFTRAL